MLNSRLVVLSATCALAFAVTVFNGAYRRATGDFLSGWLDSVVYPWFIYQVAQFFFDSSFAHHGIHRP